MKPFRARIAMLSGAAILLVANATAQTFRDPMRPAGAAPANSAPSAAPSKAVASLKLDGIIAGPTRVAIVNGCVVRAGDTIGGATIVEITHTAVHYLRAGRSLTLELPGVRPVPGVRVARSAEANTP